MFYTLQGEGGQSGRPAVFCRFAGCNLWSGHERDRSTAICQFCDTDFVGIDGSGGGKFRNAQDLAAEVASYWPSPSMEHAYVVCTGGEPLMQLDTPLVQALHEEGFEIAVETNGTIEAPDGIDWVCVSPKAGSDLLVRRGQELKLVFPQSGINPKDMEGWAFDHYFLQPMDDENLGQNTKSAIDYCMEHPKWRLSVQSHKQLGIR